jgi:hypothetical protein
MPEDAHSHMIPGGGVGGDVGTRQQRADGGS